MAKKIKITPAAWLDKNPDGSYEQYAKETGDNSPITKAMFQTKANSYKAMDSGITNDKGEKSVEANPAAKAVQNDLDKKSVKSDKKEMEQTEKKAEQVLKEADGKSADEQKDILKKESAPELPKEEKPVTVADVKEPEKEAEKPMPELNIEKDDTVKEVNEKKNTFLKNWAGTHPTLFNAVFGKDSPLTFGQRVSLLGSVLANIGANTILGAQAGFNHTGFTPIASEWGDTIRQYSGQGVNKVLGAEQEAQGKQTAAEYLADLNKENPERMAEIYATAALYSDSPEKLQSYLKAQGINASADEFKKAATDYEMTNLTEEAKQKRIDTQMRVLDAQIKEIQKKAAGLDIEKQKAIQEKLIEATNAMNEYNSVKGSSDAKTYNLEKGARYVNNVLNAVEKAASTVGGIATGGVVGSIPAVKDGIIKGDGTPQKIVKADGTEIKLDPNDNVYATLNTITTAKDNGSAVIPMEREDRAVIYQKRLGYMGNPINKDFEYYLNKLRG